MLKRMMAQDFVKPLDGSLVWFKFRPLSALSHHRRGPICTLCLGDVGIESPISAAAGCVSNATHFPTSIGLPAL